MEKQQHDKVYFVSFCLEQYRTSKKISAEEAVRMFDKYGVMEYLRDCFEVLHTQSRQWILEEIDEFIDIRRKER